MEYALDFGTSNTVMARRNGDGSLEIVAIVPSIVFVEDARTGKVTIGELKDEQSSRSFRHFKRVIALEIEGFVPELDGMEVTAKQVGSWFLREVLQQAKDATRLIVSVPIASFESYRQWLMESVSPHLEVSEVRIIDEPTAAALGYGISDREQMILVIDWGGGTVDFAVVELSLSKLTEKGSILNSLLKWSDRRSFSGNRAQPTAKVIAKAGENLGGMDIDGWIMNYLIQDGHIPPAVLTKQVAEQLKIALTTQEKVSINLSNNVVSLERSQLEDILIKNRFYERLEKCLTNLQAQLQRTGHTFNDLNAVILVGGTSQIIPLQTWLKNYFVGIPVKADNPFYAIVCGALTPNWQLQDFLYHSYAIRYWDRRHQCHNWHTIFREGQTYPTHPPYTLLLGASVPEQEKIELVIGELEASDTEIVYANNQLIIKYLLETINKAYPLNDSEQGQTIALLEPAGEVGVDRIKVTLQIDAQRTLIITVEDLLTKKILLQDQPVIKLK